MTETIWLDGVFHTRETARVSVMDHGFLYGDGIFEGTRAYGGRIFRFDAHLDRLHDSGRAIALTIPYSREEIIAASEELIRRSGYTDGYFRHVVSRGIGDLGLDPRKCPRASMVIIIDQLTMFSEERRRAGLRVITAGTPTPHRESLSPRIKSLNYLPHIMARLEANAAGMDEALMLDSTGHVAEATAQNLFIVKNGVIRTPPASAGILKGITRDVVMELAAGIGMPVREELFNRYDVYTADEAFLTGTASEIVPIREYDGRIIGREGGMGPVTSRLLEGFRDLVGRGA